MSAIFDCDLEFQDEREFYHEESEDDEFEVIFCNHMININYLFESLFLKQKSR